MSETRYDESWDRPHAPGPEDGWQESDCYWFYDADTGVGGYQRLGLKPNRGTAQIMLLAFANGGRRFSRNDSFTRDWPITGEDRWETGQRAGGHSAESLGDGRMRYRWEEEGCSADLEFSEGFYTPRGWPAAAGEAMAGLNAGGHLEVAGRLRGVVIIDAVEHEVDALAHRDRSWGYRDHSTVSLHRYRLSSGTVGPALSWATMSFSLLDGRLHSQGFVARDGETEDVTNARVITSLDADGFTTMGATTVMTLASGEVVTVEATAVQGFLSAMPPAFATCTIAEVEYDGHRGFQNLEVCPNPARGSHVPGDEEGSLLALHTGLSDTTDHSLPLDRASR
jgi:hypothetical protein